MTGAASPRGRPRVVCATCATAPRTSAAPARSSRLPARARSSPGRSRSPETAAPATTVAPMTEQPTGKIRVFLLDDHEIVRRGLKELLESEGDIEVVGESALAQEAMARIPALAPQVAILDAR